MPGLLTLCPVSSGASYALWPVHRQVQRWVSRQYHRTSAQAWPPSATISEVGWWVPHSQQDALPCSVGGGLYCLVAVPPSCRSGGGVGSLVAVMVHRRSSAYTKLNLIRIFIAGEPAYFVIRAPGAARSVTHARRRAGPGGGRPRYG
jgi:hypothetical protein